MRKFKFAKLVRDKIVDSAISNNQIPHYRVLKKKEYILELQRKIVEEAKELPDVKETEEMIKEIADIQEVLDNLTEVLRIKPGEIKKAQEKKNKKAGSFQKRIYIDTFEVPEDSEWINYLTANPEKYPEIND